MTDVPLNAITGAEEPAVELHDSEVQACAVILYRLQEKWSSRSATFENLSELRKEADELFEKIGLVVQVDWVISALSIKPQPPIITIVDRLTPFEEERHKWEIRHGAADEFYEKRKRGLI